jgi:hypothetical protein
MCNTRHVKVGSRSCKMARLQLFAWMEPLTRPPSDIWRGQSRSQSPCCGEWCFSGVNGQVLWISCKNWLQQFMLVNPYGRLPGLEKERVACSGKTESWKQQMGAYRDCCYMCVGERHDNRHWLSRIGCRSSLLAPAVLVLIYNGVIGLLVLNMQVKPPLIWQVR